MSQSIDLDRSIASAISLAPAARTASANGTGVSMAGFTECAAIVIAGVITDGTHVIKLQDSPDNASFTDIPAGNLSGAFLANIASTTTVEVGILALNPGAIFVRAVTTVSGTTTGGVYAVQLVRGGARTEPQ